MIEFSFSQTDLFNELYQFKGQTRKSVMGMFKRPSIQSAKDIANFLAYNNLGGYHYLTNGTLYVFLHKSNVDALWVENKRKELEAVYNKYKRKVFNLI